MRDVLTAARPHAHPQRLVPVALVATLVVALLAGCGGDQGKQPADKEANAKSGNGGTDPQDPKTAGTNDEQPEPKPDEPGSPNPFGPGEEIEAPTKSSWASARNGLLKQGVATAELPDELSLLWKREIPFGVPAASSIVGDHVYVPTLEGFLYCLDRRTGNEIWKYRSVPVEEDFAPGFTAPPTVTATAVFTGDEDGLVHAIDRTNGQKLWTFDTGGRVEGGPTVVDEKGESILVASHGGGLHRLRTKDGSVVWSVGEIGPINLSPPIVDGLTFALGCETGALVTVDVETGMEKSRFEFEEVSLSTPAVWKDRMYLATHEGLVRGIDFAAGKIVWTFEPKRQLTFETSCVVTEDAVFAAGQSKALYRIDRESAQQDWAYLAGAQINSSPVLVGNRVFFGSDDKHLYGVDAESGEEVFKYNLQESVTTDPAVGEGVIVVGTEGNPGGVFCFGAKDEPTSAE